MKVLLLHNTLPQYRVNLFNELAKICELTIALYDVNLNSQVYKDKNRMNELENITVVEILKDNNKQNLLKQEFDWIILPPLDDMFSIRLSKEFLKLKKSKIALFWEKWDAPKEKINFKRKVRRLIHEILTNRILKGIDLFLSPGIKTKEYLQNRGILKERITIIGDASDLEDPPEYFDIRDKYNIPKQCNLILYYGRLIERKGLKKLIDAYQLVEVSDKWLLICGDGEDSVEFQQYAKCINLKNYTFTGHIPPEYRKLYFTQSDIFVLPSYFVNGVVEAWGLTVNEALESGTPVVTTTAVGSGFDLINEKLQNGIQVEENNVIELKKAIEFCLEKNYKFSEKIINSAEMASNIMCSLQKLL